MEADLFGSSHEAVGSLEEAEDALPEVEVAAVVDAESGEEDLCLDMDYAAEDRKSQLDVWREHPNYSIGIRLAEVSTMWLVHGWQIASFPKFTNWLKEQAPGIIGNLNHSTRFVQSFQASLIQACHTCIATLWIVLLKKVEVPGNSFVCMGSRVLD